MINWHKYLDDKIKTWSNWKSTKEQPFPGSFNNEPMSDLWAVLAGTKPAAILSKKFFHQDIHPDLAYIIENELNEKGLWKLEHNNDYLVGDGDRVIKLLNELSKPTRDHKELGNLLGYAPEAIEDFTKRQMALKIYKLRLSNRI
jgi:hypothetical protein